MYMEAMNYHINIFHQQLELVQLSSFLLEIILYTLSFHFYFLLVHISNSLFSSHIIYFLLIILTNHHLQSTPPLNLNSNQLHFTQYSL